MKKLALALFAPFLMGALFAMEEMPDPFEQRHSLVGPTNMAFLKSEARKIGKNITLDVKIIPIQKGERGVAEDELSFDPDTLPEEVTLKFVLTNFQRLNQLLIIWKNASLDGAKVELRASFDDASQKFKVRGADYIDFKPEETD